MAHALPRPGWDLAKVRGTRFNTGDGIRMALDAGAMPTGNWSGGHAVGLGPQRAGVRRPGGRRQLPEAHYPFGIMVNANGERFVDEGADFRNYTYAKYGRVILSSRASSLADLRQEGAAPAARRVPHQAHHQGAGQHARGAGARSSTASTPRKALETITAFNAAVKREVPFNPNVKDGRGTVGLAVPKSNWAEHHRRAAVRGLRRHLRHHLHLRRRQDRHRRARVIDTDGAADPRPLRGGRDGRRHLLFQLSGRHGPDQRRRVRPHRRRHGGRQGARQQRLKQGWMRAGGAASTSAEECACTGLPGLLLIAAVHCGARAGGSAWRRDPQARRHAHLRRHGRGADHRLPRHHDLRRGARAGAALLAAAQGRSGQLPQAQARHRRELDASRPTASPTPSRSAPACSSTTAPRSPPRT